MNDLLKWFHDDITWCGNECSNTGCERNIVNRLSHDGLFSMALFRGTEVCPLKERNINNEQYANQSSLPE